MTPEKIVAFALMGQNPDVPDLVSPWREILDQLLMSPTQKRAEAFESAILAYENAAELRRNIYAEVRRMNSPQPQSQSSKRKETAEEIKSAGLPCPDKELRRRILDELEGANAEKRPSARMRRLGAAAILLEWLNQHGRLIQGQTGDLFYLWRDERKLFSLDSERWAAFLYSLTGANPSGTDWAYLNSDCRAAASYVERRPVVRLAAWDSDAQVLRVSRFDGSVFVLDGSPEMGKEGNGEHVIFNDDPLWLPYEPEWPEGGEVGRALDWLCSEVPNWEAETSALAFRAWLLATFCPELCPTRPLLVLVGEKGSGKSTLLRLALRLIFGPAAQVGGVPDKPDGFTALAASAHLIVLDNLDEIVYWLRDKLARVSTGADDTYRKLYSNNEAGRIIYRCWVAITSRNPDTLRRDDLADRMLPLHLGRIGDEIRQSETQLDAMRGVFRNMVWGDILTELNRAVALIRQGRMEVRSPMRMADWELLGRIFAQVRGQDENWKKLVERLSGDQSEFLLDGDPLVDALTAWLADERNPGRKMMTRELYGEWQAALYEDKRPGQEWPKSAHSFAKRLGAIKRELTAQFDVHWFTGVERINRSRTLYQFWPKGTKPVQSSF